ncbi:MAG: MoaD/ThiS family protein [Oligoflexales bacterium]
MTSISIEFFGFLKEKIPKKTWELPLEAPCSVAQFRAALIYAIENELDLNFKEVNKIIAHCAIASDQGILVDDDPIATDTVISILPPVSGG